MGDDDREIDFATACSVQQAAIDQGILLIWTVYTGTLDFGDRYVARPHQVTGGQRAPLEMYLVADTLNVIRTFLPPGLTWVNREPGDDPVIVESWM